MIRHLGPSIVILSMSLAGVAHCQNSKANGVEQTHASSSDKVRESHDRMVALLAKLSAQARKGNPYFDEEALRRLKARLDSLSNESTNGPSARRWQALRSLGVHELRLGRVVESITHLQEAITLVPSLQQQLRRKSVHQCYFDLAVAYLRLGETSNCIDGNTCCSCLYPIQGSGIHEDRRGSENAMACLTEMLRLFPDDPSAKWLLNLAAMTLGEFPSAVPKPHRLELKTPQSLAIQRLQNRSDQLGINVFDLSGGAVVDDFDGDNRFDILTSTLTPWGEMSLFLRGQDGSFVNHRDSSHLEGITGGLNMIAADYDSDGDLDVLVLRGGWFGRHGRHPNSLLRNRGDGSFDDVTFLAGLGESSFPTQTGAFGDYDLDGDLDLYLGAEATPEDNYPNQLFQNQGDGTFLDVTERAGVRDGRFTKAVVFGDYDNDRYPDIYVSNLDGENRLYHNQTDGTFKDVAVELSVEKPIKSFPAWFFDFDNDGFQDIFVSSYWANIQYFAADQFGIETEAEPCCLYRNRGDGSFENVTKKVGLMANFQPMGANFGDIDNDGFLDMYLGTGYPGYEGLMPNVFFWNQKGESFLDASIESGLGHLQKGHGVSFADVDFDGDKDLFIQLGGAYPGDSYYNALFENPGNDNRWIKLKLIGKQCNRSAIGARIKVIAMRGSEKRFIFATVCSGGSFGVNPLLQEIGLGACDRVDIEILWPVSGETQRLENLDLNQTFEIVEGESSAKHLNLGPLPFSK